MAVKNLLRMEERYGPLGSGSDVLEINGKVYTLWELLKALGLLNEGGLRPIDALPLANENLYAVRYLDLPARSVIAYEFYPDFRYRREMRVHLADILGEEQYGNIKWDLKCHWGL